MKKTRRRGLLPLPAALLLACAAPSGERETAVVESAVVVGGVASSCSVNTDCLSGMQCTSVQRCACAPGKIACGDYCFDLSNDSSHCGSCTTRCAKGTSCTAGACGLSISPLFTVDTPIEIDGASAATTCSEATEAYPEYSTNTGTAAFFMPFQFNSRAVHPCLKLRTIGAALGTHGPRRIVLSLFQREAWLGVIRGRLPRDIQAWNMSREFFNQVPRADPASELQRRVRPILPARFGRTP